jgi:hypothetical protein
MDRQTTPVPSPAVRPNVDEPPNIIVHLAPEVSLNHETVVHNFPDSVQVTIAQFVHFRITGHISLLRDPTRQGVPNPIDTGESDFYPFIIWNIDVCNTCHVLSLPLFMPRVWANNPQHTTALDLSAFVTPRFD